MKPILTLSFSSPDEFKKVRDFAESINPPAYTQSGTGKDGKFYIKLFSGTDPVFIWKLAQYTLNEKVLNISVEGKEK